MIAAREVLGACVMLRTERLPWRDVQSLNVCSTFVSVSVAVFVVLHSVERLPIGRLRLCVTSGPFCSFYGLWYSLRSGSGLAFFPACWCRNLRRCAVFAVPRRAVQ